MLPTSHDSKKEKLKDILLGLHWAATTGNVGLIKFALDHGVPIDSVVNGFVPLQLACINDNNIAAVQYLIDRGADVNNQNWSKKYSVDKTQAVQGATGSTALHVACANNCVKIVDLLIRNNAKIDVKDKYGSTPFDVAQAKHETEIMNLLKSARAPSQRKETQRSKQGSTYHDELQPNEAFARKSTDGIMTHKRTLSDKLPTKIRRPSLPSIVEGQQPPLFITMTPANNDVVTSRRSFSSTHRPAFLAEDNHIHTHSCPVTPRTSLDQHIINKRTHSHSLSIPPTSISSRSSSEDTQLLPSTSPAKSAHSHIGSSASTGFQVQLSANGHPDWYGYGVVNQYEDGNYLLSLERRAFNLTCDENGGLERHSQETSRRSYDFGSLKRQYNAEDNSDTQLDTSSFSESTLQPLRTVALKNSMTVQSTGSSVSTAELTSSLSDGNELEDDEEDEYEREPSPRPMMDNGPDIDRCQQERPHSTDQPEMKKGWFAAIGKEANRHSFDAIQRKDLKFLDHLTIKKGNQEESSDEDEFQKQKGGFFSRWAPAWSKK